MSVYNGEDFIASAIDSILAQTFEDFEFIIINDGSTDKTKQIIKSYKDKRIRLFNQKNHGLVYSLNKGVESSVGEFIARQDADDISLPNRFTLELDWLKLNKQNALVSSYFSHIDFMDRKPNGTDIIFPINDIDIKRLLYSTNPMAHGASMFRKEAIVKSGLYSNNYGPAEDYELWKRMSKNSTFRIIPEVLYWYRINNEKSISKKNIKKQTYFINKIREELWAKPFIKKNPYKMARDYLEMKNQIPYKYLLQAKSEYRNSQFDIAKELMLRRQILNSYYQLAGLLLVFPAGFLRVLKYLPGLHWAVLKNKMKRVYSL